MTSSIPPAQQFVPEFSLDNPAQRKQVQLSFVDRGTTGYQAAIV
jgi:hypothetical protein